jgi:Cof subfamily protein (haloacid dehalogenase superfamily)
LSDVQTKAVDILALDLDGTLIGRTLRISQAVKDAVRRAAARGVRITIVTGRMFAAARPFALELEIDGPIICYQGAAIFDVRSGQKLREVALPHDIAITLAKKAKADGFHVQLYRDDRFYVESLSQGAEIYAAIAGLRPVVVDSLEVTFADSGSTKLVIVADPERCAAYEPAVKAFCGSGAYVTRSQPEFIEVLDPRVDKGEALRWVAARLGSTLDSSVAVGDSWNDAPLLEAVGFGIAMGSAPRELIACADAIVADVDHDGVAEAIEKFVIK